MALNIVILAAGEGSRMHSAHAKVLHELAGKPLLEHVVATAQTLEPVAIHIVYGYCGEQVRSALSHLPVNWVEQKEQLGTGHAVDQALPFLKEDDQVLVLYGDVPLISTRTLKKLITATPKHGVGIIASEFSNPTGLGRVVRDSSGNIKKIVEHRDANEKELQIKEVYTGILTAPVKLLKEWLPELSNKNSQNEYYLTDVIKLAVKSQHSVIAVLSHSPQEVNGVNDRFQLADLERYYQIQAARRVMLQGASVKDPARFDLRGSLSVNEDVVFDVNVIIEGDVSIGRNTTIGPNTIIRNSKIGENVIIKANSIIEDSTVEANCIIGPFARIRPETELAEHSHIGNFVEVKKSKIGQYTKINHLSYIGDSIIGEHVNIGAGTITCNYDGFKKHQTIIGDHAFIGSNTELIAPITIGENATIAAGSTVCENAPAGKLTISRVQQTVVDAWVRPAEREE